MFSGSIPALVTPFRDGAFDEAAFRRLVDWQIASGSTALVPCGTTGEASTLSNEEHHRVIEVCVDQVAGRVPVIAGCGSNDTRTALMHMEFSRKCGASAALDVAAAPGQQEGFWKILLDDVEIAYDVEPDASGGPPTVVVRGARVAR